MKITGPSNEVEKVVPESPQVGGTTDITEPLIPAEYNLTNDGLTMRKTDNGNAYEIVISHSPNDIHRCVTGYRY